MASGARPYAYWVAQMAVGTNIGMPSVICKQDDTQMLWYVRLCTTLCGCLVSDT